MLLIVIVIIYLLIKEKMIEVFKTFFIAIFVAVFLRSFAYEPFTIPSGSMTKMPQCMPDEFKEECSVSAYRHFYNVDKRRSFKCVWTDREEPHWWKEHTCLGA